VSIVIDDFGVDLEIARKFATLPFPINFSILPHQRYSRAIARLAHAHNHEVLLHLPMEPQGFPKVNPGKGALLLSMSNGRMKKALQSSLDSHPYISGVNNHMGSRFTEHEHSMEVVLKELKRKGLYFLDSRTSKRTLGLSLAQKLRVPSAGRDIFLDHVRTETFIRSQIKKLIRKAKVQGRAIGIGHPYDVTLRVLTHEAGRFRQQNIEVIPLKTLIGNRFR
jgi:polysaccharide deacetylase 2 family uncharacterized protein YibQ